MESVGTAAMATRAVNELLGKYICAILPSRRESDTFPAKRERQEGRFCLTKK